MNGSRRDRTALLLSMACALAMTGGVDRKAAVRNREANQAFGEQRFEEAVDLYNEALTEAPESEHISYNLGNAFYRQKQFEEAASALARASQTEDPEVRHHSLYNLGNTFFNSGQLPEAIEAYRTALEIKPDDLDTKINFEKALRMQQQQEDQQQQQQQDQQSQDQNQQQQDQNPDSQQGENQDQQQQQSEPQDNQEQKDDSQEQQDGSENQESGESDEQQPPEEQQQPQEVGIDSLSVPEGEMRPEEALRILEAMREQEKELQKERARKARARARRVDKDW